MKLFNLEPNNIPINHNLPFAFLTIEQQEEKDDVSFSSNLKHIHSYIFLISKNKNEKHKLKEKESDELEKQKQMWMRMSPLFIIYKNR